MLREALRDPLFGVGLLVRLALIIFVVPQTYMDWFVPFLEAAARSGALDIWTAFLEGGGAPDAFPYGPIYVVMLAPGVFFGGLIDDFLGKSGAALGLGLSVLIYDFLLYVTLIRLLPDKTRMITTLYWLSPIIIYVCYWHGQLDIVPIVILVYSLVLLSRLRIAASGAIIGLAVSAKLSMAIAVPFIIAYLVNSKRMQSLAPRYAGAVVLMIVAALGPALLSAGAQTMVLQSPQIDKIYALAVSLPGGLNIYLIPLVYLIILFAAWRIGRISFDLLLALLGIAFFLLLLLATAAPGWFIWVVPFLVIYQIRGGLTGKVLTAVFAALFVALNLLGATGSSIPILDVDLRAPLIAALTEGQYRAPSLILSVLIATGLVLCYQMIREGVLLTDYYILSRRPLAIGIAGDSGSGKDSLADSLEGLFGSHSVARISGDDYHNWDRNQPMWSMITHLNPQANDLHQFNQDVFELMAGRSVRVHHYDHTTGYSSNEHLVRHNDVVIASGLHALYSPELLRRYDLRVFLDMDPALRRYLKLWRDVDERGAAEDAVLESIEKREPDGSHFVAPQKDSADLIISLRPLHPDLLEDTASRREPRLKLSVLMPKGANSVNLVRSLIAVCGMHVEVLMREDEGRVEIWVEGEADADDIAMSASHLVPHIEDLLDINPKWQPGVSGVMQLFVLTQAVQALKERRL